MTPLVRITALVVASVFASRLAGGYPNTAIVRQICTKRHHQENKGGYDICLYYVNNEIAAMTAMYGYSYSFSGRSQDEFTGRCYGHGACNGKLQRSDCTSCLYTALEFTLGYCTSSVGAQTKLEDCRIRYEDHPFSDEY